MNTCSTCKHWDRSYLPMPSSEDEYHVCRGVPIGIAILALEHITTTQQVLSTSAEFGCPKWEEEPGRAFLAYMQQHQHIAEMTTGIGDDVRQFRPAMSRAEIDRIVTLLEKDVG